MYLVRFSVGIIFFITETERRKEEEWNEEKRGITYSFHFLYGAYLLK